MEIRQKCYHFAGNTIEKHIGLLKLPFQLNFAVFGHGTAYKFGTYDNFRCKQDFGVQNDQKISSSSPSSGNEYSIILASE